MYYYFNMFRGGGNQEININYKIFFLEKQSLTGPVVNKILRFIHGSTLYSRLVAKDILILYFIMIIPYFDNYQNYFVVLNMTLSV